MTILGTIAFIAVMAMAANWRPMDGPFVALGFIFGGLGLLFGLRFMAIGISVMRTHGGIDRPSYGMATICLAVGTLISIADIAATHWFLKNATDLLS
jgi:hypothetical protein